MNALNLFDISNNLGDTKSLVLIPQQQLTALLEKKVEKN